MGSGPDRAGSGYDEKANLIAQITADTSLGADAKAQYLAKANAIATDNIKDLGFGMTRSQTIDDVTALQSEYTTKAAERTKMLTANQATVSAQLEALNATPGSRQTTKLTALMASPTPSLVPGGQPK